MAKQLAKREGIASRILDKLRLPHKSKAKVEEYEKNLWKTLLLSLAKRSFDERKLIAKKSHELLFSLLYEYHSTMKDNLWELVFHELLRAIFDDLNVSVENKDLTTDNFQRHMKNTDLMVNDLVNLISSMDHSQSENVEKDTDSPKEEAEQSSELSSNGNKFKSSTIIFVQIIKNFVLSYPESPLGQELLRGLIDITKVNSQKFNKDLCKSLVQAVCILLDETLATDLLGEPQEEGKSETNASETKKSQAPVRLSTLCNNQSIQQLQLLSCAENLIEAYDHLEYHEIKMLLDRVQNSYKIAHQFNMNIERRVEVLKNGGLKPLDNLLPGLFKQERQSLKIYFNVLHRLYRQPKEEIGKQDAAGLIFDFASEVLKEYSNNYEAIMHSDEGNTDSPSLKETYKYEVLDLKTRNEEINRVLVALSSIFSESIFKTLLMVDDEDMNKHIKTLTPILIDLTVSDQLPFRLRLRELLKKSFKQLY